MDTFNISQVSQLLGLSPHTLRYYERAGLLDPVQQQGGRRQYGQQDIAWLRFIQRLRATDMPMRQISHYAELRRSGDSTLVERMALLEAHLQALLQRERELASHRQALSEKIDVYREMIQVVPANKGIQK